MEDVLPRDRARPRLFEEFPVLAGTLPWRALAHAPTPVERCDAITDYLGRGDVWMKRDDRVSPLYGGNKVRRYEFVLADALARGATTIVTAGGLASTQAMATALFGRALGLRVQTVMFDQPVTRFARRALLANVTAGAELVYGGGYLATAWKTYRLLRAEKRSYLILPGAANPLANLGYFDAMLELGDDVRAGRCPRPDVIVLPTGSSGTLAALALGARYLGWDTEVVGARITSIVACNPLSINAIIAATAKFLLARVPTLDPARLEFPRYSLFHRALGRGYGHPTPESVEAVPVVQKLIGVPGEVTYTGKALACVRALCRDEAYRGKTILLWNTLSGTEPPVDPDARERLPPEFAFVFEGEPPV